MEQNKRRLFAALSNLGDIEMGFCEIVEGKRKPSEKMITLPLSSSLSLPPLPHEDDEKSLQLLPTRSSTSPTTPLEKMVNSTSSSSSSSSEFRQSPSPPTTLVVKEEYKENRVVVVAAAAAAVNMITPKKHERTVEKENNVLITNKKQKITQETETSKKKPVISKKGKEKVRALERRMPTHMFKLITGNQVQGLDIKWLDIKPIKDSDIKKNQNRLRLPISDDVEEIMTSDEIKNVRDLRKHMEVHVFDPKYVVRKLNMSYWPTPGKYYLITLWSELARANKLEKECHVAEIWSFRNQLGMLCFAMNFGKIGDEVKENEDPTAGVLVSEVSTSGHGSCGGNTSCNLETTLAA